MHKLYKILFGLLVLIGIISVSLTYHGTVVRRDYEVIGSEESAGE